MRSLRKCFPPAWALFFLLFLIVSQAQARHQAGPGIRKVVIDAGHGGRDPGAIGSRIKEKDIVLKVALKVGESIRKNNPEVEVIYTRKTDVFVELENRARIATQSNADVFISIHANSIARRKNEVRGTETYVLGVDKANANMEIVQRENAVILLEEGYKTRYEGFDPKSAESYIMFSLMQNAYLNQSLQLAQEVQSMFKTATALQDKGVKQAGFLVLARTSMPAVLVEIGYISNVNDEKYLMSETGQDKIASAIFNAFVRYKQTVDNRSSLHNTTASPANATTAPPPVKEAIPETKEAIPEVVEEDQDSVPWLYVQILASKTPVPANSPDFKKIKGVVSITESEYYRYGALKTRSLTEAQQKLKEIKVLFPNAFITATSNGKIIPVQQAVNQIKR